MKKSNLNNNCLNILINNKMNKIKIKFYKINKNFQINIIIKIETIHQSKKNLFNNNNSNYKQTIYKIYHFIKIQIKNLITIIIKLINIIITNNNLIRNLNPLMLPNNISILRKQV